MKRLLFILLLFSSFAGYSQGKPTRVNNRVIYNAIGSDIVLYVAKDTLIGYYDSAYVMLSVKNGIARYFDSSIAKRWLQISSGGVSIDTSIYKFDGSITGPGDRTLNLNGHSLVFQDGSTTYVFGKDNMNLSLHADDDSYESVLQGVTDRLFMRHESGGVVSEVEAGDNGTSMLVNSTGLAVSTDSVIDTKTPGAGVLHKTSAGGYYTAPAKNALYVGVNGTYTKPDSINISAASIGIFSGTTGGIRNIQFYIPPGTASKQYYYYDSTIGSYYAKQIDYSELSGTPSITYPVTSVFGRTGAVTAQSGDYSAYYPLLSGSYANPAWITSLPWSKITGAPTTLAGYGITDPVVLTTGSYANPAWITSLAKSKITGANFDNYDSAYQNNIVSGSVTGTTTKTINLIRRNGSAIPGLSFTDSIGGGTAITSTYVAVGTGTGITGNAGLTFTDASNIQTLKVGAGVSGSQGIIELPHNTTMRLRLLGNSCNIQHDPAQYVLFNMIGGGNGKIANIAGAAFTNSSKLHWVGNAFFDGQIVSYTGSAGNASKLIAGYQTSQNAAFVQSAGAYYATPISADPTSVDGMTWASSTANRFRGQIGGSIKSFVMYGDPVAFPGTPSSTADASGSTGEIRYDDTYLYVKTSAGWKRLTLSSF